MGRRHWIRRSVLALLWVACDLATAAESTDRGRDYAFLSLIGDSLTLVTYEPATASNLDRNLRESVRLGDASFDRVALGAVAASVARRWPASHTTPLAVGDPAAAADSDDLVSSSERLAALLAPVAARLGSDGPAALILITKHRDLGGIRAATGNLGEGRLSGLGFYIDRVHPMMRSDTGLSARGFLAPYAFIAVSLVDLRSGRVLRTRSIRESTTLSAARAKDAINPWDTLDPAQKVRMLEAMIRRGIDTALPVLLDPPPGEPG